MNWADVAGGPELLAKEVGDAELGDQRLTKRLATVMTAAAVSPASSFPEMSGSDAALEGTYRFLGNERVTPEAILAPHFRATAARVRASEQVVIAHDTTQFSFGCVARGDLERVGQGKTYGFNAHVSLAITGDQSRVALGVLAVKTYNRAFGSKRAANGKNKDKRDNAMHRWSEGVRAVRSVLGDADNVIHVFDREADDYALLAELIESKERFVVRQAVDRRLVRHRPEKVRSLVASSDLLARNEVTVAAHRKPPKKTHASRTPIRSARAAQLEVRAVSVTIPRTVGAGGRGPEHLQLNLVEAVEKDPPTGQQPVCWWLWTTEPIDTDEQVLTILDTYRTRWVIEEYFKVIKTGCRMEQRQLESKHALFNALAVFIPVAWRLLAVRSIARQAPDAPCSTSLSPLQERALRGYMKKRHGVVLPALLTTRTAMLAIAQMGGHIRNNGDPGWIVLGRGFDRLLDVEVGLAIALGCDQ